MRHQAFNGLSDKASYLNITRNTMFWIWSHGIICRWSDSSQNHSDWESLFLSFWAFETSQDVKVMPLIAFRTRYPVRFCWFHHQFIVIIRSRCLFNIMYEIVYMVSCKAASLNCGVHSLTHWLSNFDVDGFWQGPSQGPFSRTWIYLIPAWIRNHMSGIMWDEITHPFRNFYGSTVEVSESICNFILQFAVDVITYPCWG